MPVPVRTVRSTCHQALALYDIIGPMNIVVLNHVSLDGVGCSPPWLRAVDVGVAWSAASRESRNGHTLMHFTAETSSNGILERTQP
jgi:hypothetical protein